MRSADGDPVPIHCEAPRQPAKVPIYLLRLHVEEAGAAMSHGCAEAAGCQVLGELPHKLPADTALVYCIARTS